MKKYLKLITIICFILFETDLIAQKADVNLTMYVTKTGHSEYGTTGGDCWESGDEEYTGKVWFWTEVDGTWRGGTCRQCNANGDCNNTNWTDGYTYYNTAAEDMDAYLDAWEDDGGDRCSYGSAWNYGDDCRTESYLSATGANRFFREAFYPSNGNYSFYGGNQHDFGDDDHWAQVALTWRYTGTANAITMSCTPQTSTQASGRIRSHSVYLTAGNTYRFQTTSGPDTYLRLYGSDGYTIVASNDDGGSGTLSLINYTAGSTGWYYIETSRWSRNPLTSNAVLEYEDITGSEGDATLFGTNEWRVYGYNHSGYNFADQMNLTNVRYEGFYTDGNIDITSTDRWASGASPSSATGWTGCDVTFDNHLVIYKRKGFPCGYYNIDLDGNDDGVRLYIDGASVYQLDGCCADRGIIWSGYLDANSTVEFRVSEGGGGSNLSVDFDLVNRLNTTASVLNNGACNKYDINIIKPTGSEYNWFQSDFSGENPANTQVNGSASYTGGVVQLTPNSGSQYGGFSIDNTRGFNASDVNLNFNFYIGDGGGADGMSVSYGNVLMNGSHGESGGGNGIIIRMVTYSGAGQKVQLVYNGSVLATYAGFPWRNIANVPVSLNVTNGIATVVINGTTVFNNVNLGAGYLAANKTGWRWNFSARTGGVSDRHYIDNVKITANDYEYSIGAGWQSSLSFTNVNGGSSYTVQARPRAYNSCVTTITSFDLPNMNPVLSATGISPTCYNGNDGSIDLSVSGFLQGARVVKIVQLSNEPLNTNEIQIFESESNINVGLTSQGGLAAQSSSPYSPSYIAALLNDGNLHDAVGAHTSAGVGQWQKITLNKPTSIDRIVIWNRDNCCNTRLNNLRLEIYGDAAETKLLFAKNIDADNGLAQSFTLNVGNNFAWSNGSTTEDISGLSAGAYNVTLTDDFGCVATLNGTTVSNPNTQTLSAVVTNELCPADDNGSIDLTVSSQRKDAEPPAFSNLAIWTKADAGVVKNKEGEVVQWQDLSGNDNHFYTTIGSNVQAVASSINSKPAIRFDATNIMETKNVITGNFTLIVVGKLNGPTNQRLVGSSIKNWLFGWWGGIRDQFFAEGWISNPNTASNLTDAYIYTGTGNIGADQYSFWRNGTNLVTNSSGGSQAPGAISLGGLYFANNTEKSNGDIAEVIAYDRVLTSDERMAVEKYLSDKYNISGPTGVNPKFAWSPGGATTEDISSKDAGSYTVTVTDAAGCTTEDTYSIDTDKTESTAPSAALASNVFVCSGDAVSLSVSGGSLGTGSVWEWATSSSFGTIIGTGIPFVVYPTTTTTYFVRAKGDCNTTSYKPVTILVNGSNTAPNASVALATATSTSTCIVNDNNWHYFYNSSGELLAAINSKGQNLGNVKVEITVGDVGPFGQGLPPGVCGYTGASAGEYVMPRYWDITVDNQPSSAVDVKFYYTNTDVATIVSTTGGLNQNYKDCWGEITSESDLMMTIDHGTSQETRTISPAGASFGGALRQIDFSLMQFSGGKLHSKGGVHSGNPLPVELIEFNAKTVNNKFVLLKWTTATEINNSGFDIERSIDGINFEKIGHLNGNGNSNIINYYSYQDNNVKSGIYYYRLKQIDFDGTSEYSEIRNASILGDDKLSVSNFIPNPAENSTSINFIAVSDIQVSIVIYDGLGRKVIEEMKHLIKGSNDINFDIRNLAVGVYTAKILVAKEEYTRKLVIKK